MIRSFSNQCDNPLLGEIIVHTGNDCSCDFLNNCEDMPLFSDLQFQLGSFSTMKPLIRVVGMWPIRYGMLIILLKIFFNFCRAS